MKADDIVFTEIGATLNLDDGQRKRAGVLDPMGRARGDEGRFLGMDISDLFPDSHPCQAGHHNPMLTPMMVKLKAQATARIHVDLLDLVRLSLPENCPSPPRAYLGDTRKH
jgi:hypothetical protein